MSSQKIRAKVRIVKGVDGTTEEAAEKTSSIGLRFAPRIPAAAGFQRHASRPLSEKLSRPLRGLRNFLRILPAVKNGGLFSSVPPTRDWFITFDKIAFHKKKFFLKR